MLLRYNVRLHGITLILEGEDDSDKLTILKIGDESHGQFSKKVIDAAIEHNKALVYTDAKSPYTGPLTRILRARETYADEEMPEEIATDAMAALDELITNVVVSYHPSTGFTPRCTLKFYMGTESNTHSITNFWAANVCSVEPIEASLVA